MSQALNEIKDLLNQTSLTLEDQNDLLVFLPILPESVLKELVHIFQENPDFIEELNAQFKAKYNALTGQGDKNWDQIIEEEIKESNELPEEELIDEIEEIEKENL